MPGPVCQWCINQQREQYDEKDIRFETNPFCEGTCDERWCDNCEFQLEKREENQWNSSEKRSIQNSIKHEVSHRVSYKSSDVISKGKAEAYHDP